LLLNAKADTVKPSVTASLTIDTTHAENSKIQLFTKEMVELVVLILRKLFSCVWRTKLLYINKIPRENKNAMLVTLITEPAITHSFSRVKSIRYGKTVIPAQAKHS